MADTSAALVIGGGIAGPVAAMALQKAGIQATVYEAYSGPAEGIGGPDRVAPVVHRRADFRSGHVVPRLEL